MSSFELIDSDLKDFFSALPRLEFTRDSLPTIREQLALQAMASLPDPVELSKSAGVTCEEIFVDGLREAPPVRCLKFAPRDKAAQAPAMLSIHGGGLILGTPEIFDSGCFQLASDLGAVVLSVDYRLAPEHPYPAALDDCMASLAWLFENAASLGVDPEKIAVGGMSAGGGLAASVALRARDEGQYKLACQHLVCPMLDDRTGGPDGPSDSLVGEFGWTRQNNQFGWSSYLGNFAPAAPAVPAREVDLAGLPPTWIHVGSLDLFLDENIAYARRLISAGVATELQVYPGAPHGFQNVVEASITRRFHRDSLHALARNLKVAI